MPVGVVTQSNGDDLHLRGVVLSPDGKSRLETQGKATASEGEMLGHMVAQDLLSKGARQLLESV